MDDRLTWAGKDFDREELAPHYAVLGTVGSGKTLTIQMLMRSVLGPGPEPKVHAVIFDPKLENYPVLRTLYGTDCIIVTHPLDRRSAPWSVSEDVLTRAQSKGAGSNFCPTTGKESQPFFPKAARRATTGCLDSFRLRNLDWNLNDLVEANADLATLKAVLGAHPDTEGGAEALSRNPKQASDVFETARGFIDDIAPAAAAWARSSNVPFSVTSWLAGPPSILLLASDPVNAASIDPINRSLFQLLSQHVMSQPAGGEKEVWFFLDEARLLGELAGLEELLLKGRSKQVHVVLGLQDILGFRHVYGDKRADELLGNCGNMAILRLNTPESARWASDLIGSYESETELPSTSETVPGEGKVSTTTTFNRNIQERKSFLEQEFARLTTPSWRSGRGFDGVFTTREDRWIGHVDSETIEDKGFLEPTKAQVQDLGFEPVPAEQQERLRWTPERRKRMTGQPPQPTASLVSLS